jgi:deferrochelatase/peroxidase EfeB
MASGASVPAVVEPVLDMDDIQGIAVPGFFKPHQTLLQVRLGTAGISDLRVFLQEFRVSTAAETLADRRAHRAGKANVEVLTAIGLAWPALRAMAPDAATIESPAFRTGLAGRSALLGDPDDPGDPGHAKNWEVGGTGRDLDALIVFAGDRRHAVSAAAMAVAAKLRAVGTDATHQDGDVLPGALEGHEHFGFDDGVSQPGIRGRASAKADDYITPRFVDPAADPYAAAMNRLSRPEPGLAG